MNWSDLREGDVVLGDPWSSIDAENLPVLLILRASVAGIAYVDLATGRTTESKSYLGEMLPYWTVLKREGA